MQKTYTKCDPQSFRHHCFSHFKSPGGSLEAVHHSKVAGGDLTFSLCGRISTKAKKLVYSEQEITLV